MATRPAAVASGRGGRGRGLRRLGRQQPRQRVDGEGELAVVLQAQGGKKATVGIVVRLHRLRGAALRGWRTQKEDGWGRELGAANPVE